MESELERVRKALRELGKLLKNLPADPPAKDVHKLRTVARRVEAIAAVLPLEDGKESRRLLKKIEPVRKAAGGVRDMDVLTANARRLMRYCPGDSLDRLIALLQNARQDNSAELLRTLTQRRKSARQQLKEYTRLVQSALPRANSQTSANGAANRIHVGIQTAAMNVVRELESWPPLDQGNIHAFRLKVKELRYILQLHEEADSHLIDALANVQRRVGDWHDWQQLGEIAREVLNPENDAALLDRIDHHAKRKLDQALSAANRLRGKYLAMPPAYGA